MKNNIITRIAPSPTGLFHLGTARTALFNYLFAKQHQGKFIFRLDDTDRERSRPEYVDDIAEAMSWLGLTADETYRQSEHQALYRAKLEELLAQDKIYWSQEEIKEAGDRTTVLRFRNPNRLISFRDLVRGDIEFATADLGDFVVAKDLDTPLYHFASVADDLQSEITHVIRGEDHISNTPRQILLIEALGGERPLYAHLPIIMAPDKSKLSKRKHGELAAISAYRRQGYLPEAVINFIALLGWSPQSGQTEDRNEEVLTLPDLLAKFDLTKVGKSGASLHLDKLNWLNRVYLKRLPAQELKRQVLSFLPAEFTKEVWYDEAMLVKILPLILDRLDRLDQVTALAQAGELTYFFRRPEPTAVQLKTPASLAATAELIAAIPEEDFTHETVRAAVWPRAEAVGKGQVLWPLRVALTGLDKSPDPFTVAAVLGKTETLARLLYAQKITLPT
ncbi:MAG: hypothetical protein COV08_02980 [Candidatus Vogelbacteria bacterium CG10_big_fil_rev_8_21_14_0_10_49_38]|uniref:Glutamate--tRNA ligase n=1 Tax=Candidatus Vogelbacteria bacterium CG10_big_fil_rev_8_21_14_0_10_49_38 TaxID=1975043 RepID=A0A2H0RJ76_9BACT|nr:MAG: hypothetical protein BK006_02990 [bacterium CG10_49_38]PIR45835.1 MAG: hypothetical protein COV08_02980 [Candidatus Vogelbacteria bacterium CG10_big_fil_rev_8_21_14_0_10_49_38]